MSIQAFLGVDTVLTKSGEVPVATLEGKTVMLYFSAHWCGPCRGFTPKLAEFYTNLKKKRDDFEILFVSSDKDQAAFDSYYGDHPWMALPYSARSQKDKLSSKLKVQGIPTLAVIDKDGNVITTKARGNVTSDPEGKNFPWVPKGLGEILAAGPIVGKDGKEFQWADLKDKDGVALYFSAHWCPPCKRFTPMLAEVYKKMQAKSVKQEIIFVTSDNSEEEFDEYYGEMPWATLPFGDDRIAELNQTLEINGIPSLVTLKPDGTIINKDASGPASSDSEGADFPWVKKPLPQVCELVGTIDGVIDALNSNTCVVLNAGGDAAAMAAYADAAKQVDEEYNAKQSDDDDKIRFFKVEGDKNIFDRLLQMMGAEAPAPSVLLFTLQTKKSMTIKGDIAPAERVVQAVYSFKKGD